MPTKRDAVIRLKFTRKEYGLADLIHIYRAELAVNLNRIDCDLYQALAANDFSDYQGEYIMHFTFFCCRM